MTQIGPQFPGCYRLIVLYDWTTIDRTSPIDYATYDIDCATDDHDLSHDLATYVIVDCDPQDSNKFPK